MKQNSKNESGSELAVRELETQFRSVLADPNHPFSNLFISCRRGVNLARAADGTDFIDRVWNDWDKLHTENKLPADCLFSPLHFAAAFGHAEIVVKLLKDKKMNPNVLPIGSASSPAPAVTPLDFACKYNHPKVIAILLKAGAKPECSQSANSSLDGLTPLMWCLINNVDIELLKQLINKTPKEFLHAPFVKIQNGANAETQHTALSVAVTSLSVPGVRALLLRGVSPHSSIMPGKSVGEMQTLLAYVLKQCVDEKHSKTAKKKLHDIAQLLWIHKASLEMSEPLIHFEDKGLDSPMVTQAIDLKEPAIRLCRAAYSALGPVSQEDYERGKDLFHKMLESVHNWRIEVLDFVCTELNRKIPGYFGAQYKVSLNTDNFQCDFLRNIFEDETLLNSLGIKVKQDAPFNDDLTIREQFREQLIRGLQSYKILSSSISSPKKV